MFPADAGEATLAPSAMLRAGAAPAVVTQKAWPCAITPFGTSPKPFAPSVVLVQYLKTPVPLSRTAIVPDTRARALKLSQSIAEGYGFPIRLKCVVAAGVYVTGRLTVPML